jgi:hypothetical protein
LGADAGHGPASEVEQTREVELNIKEGDRVRLKPLIVQSVGSTSVCVDWPGFGNFLLLDHDDIEEVIPAPRPLAVGDKVRHDAYAPGCYLTVLAIDGEMAWCRSASGQHPVMLLSTLTRA